MQSLLGKGRRAGQQSCSGSCLNAWCFLFGGVKGWDCWEEGGGRKGFRHRASIVEQERTPAAVAELGRTTHHADLPGENREKVVSKFKEQSSKLLFIYYFFWDSDGSVEVARVSFGNSIFGSHGRGLWTQAVDDTSRRPQLRPRLPLARAVPPGRSGRQTSNYPRKR